MHGEKIARAKEAIVHGIRSLRDEDRFAVVAYDFIESAVQIPDFVAGEVGEALEVTVREAVLVVAAGPGVLVESVNDFPCRVDGDVSRIALGSLYSGQELQPVLRLVFPAGAPGVSRTVTFRLEDHRGALEGAAAVLTFTWTSHGENDRQPHDRDVLRLVAAANAARAERDALERNAAGDFGGARAILMRCARRIERYGQGDETLRDLARSLREKAALYSRDLDSLSRKASYALASSSLKGRLTGPGRAHSHSGGGGGAAN